MFAETNSIMKALQQLRSKYIVELIAIQETEEKIYILMEYCDGGDLLRRLQVSLQSRLPSLVAQLRLTSHIATTPGWKT